MVLEVLEVVLEVLEVVLQVVLEVLEVVLAVRVCQTRQAWLATPRRRP